MTDLDTAFEELLTAELRSILADIVFAAVPHRQDTRYEIVPRSVLDTARAQLQHSDIEAAAERERARREFKMWKDG